MKSLVLVASTCLLVGCSQPPSLEIRDLRWELTNVEPVNDEEVRVTYIVENLGDGAGDVECTVTAVHGRARATRNIQIGPRVVWEESGVLPSLPEGLDGEPPDLDCRLGL